MVAEDLGWRLLIQDVESRQLELLNDGAQLGDNVVGGGAIVVIGASSLDTDDTNPHERVALAQNLIEISEA